MVVFRSEVAMRFWCCVLWLGGLSGCVRPIAAFTCTSSDQCTEGGVCQPVGFCSFADQNCPSGQIYGAASGALGGLCVGSEPMGIDAPLGCDRAKPFGSPTLVGGLAASTEDASLRLSPDENTAYFFSARSGKKLLYTAHRSSANAAFTNVEVLANVNTSDQYNPTITADGLTLFFAAYRDATNNNDIFQASRSESTGDFTNPHVAPNVNTTASEVQPYITRDGTTMYFVRTVAAAQTVLRAVGSVTAGFANPGVVAELDGPTNDSDPVLSADGLTLYWGSDRPGGLGDVDVWQIQRPSTTEPFGAPAPIESVNTAGFDAPSDVSADGCRLYLTSTRGGRTSIYVATRPP